MDSLKLKNSKNTNETNIEKIMREELERRGIKMVPQFSVRSGFILDFAEPDKRVGVECDGWIWHTGSRKRSRDGLRDHILRRGGWKIIRFWDFQIETNIKGCVDVIQKELK